MFQCNLYLVGDCVSPERLIPRKCLLFLTVGSPREVREVELNLVPTLVETHGHGANEGLHPCRGLVVGRPKATTNILVVKNLHFEAEVLLQVLDDHDEERKLDPQSPRKPNQMEKSKRTFKVSKRAREWRTLLLQLGAKS